MSGRPHVKMDIPRESAPIQGLRLSPRLLQPMPAYGLIIITRPPIAIITVPVVIVVMASVIPPVTTCPQTENAEKQAYQQ